MGIVINRPYFIGIPQINITLFYFLLESSGLDNFIGNTSYYAVKLTAPIIANSSEQCSGFKIMKHQQKYRNLGLYKKV